MYQDNRWALKIQRRYPFRLLALCFECDNSTVFGYLRKN